MPHHRINAAAAAVAAACALAGSAVAGGFQDQLPPGWTHAEINVVGKDGAAHTIIFDRGRVQSVSGSALVLRERDGSVVTIPVSPQTRVRVNGQAASIAEVKVGFRATTLRIDGGAARQVRAFDPTLRPPA